MKPGICNLFLRFCFLMLSSKRSFSNPVFQNSCSNPYFWGVKTRVSKFGFKTDIENLKLDQLNFWSTLIGPISEWREESHHSSKITLFFDSVIGELLKDHLPQLLKTIFDTHFDLWVQCFLIMALKRLLIVSYLYSSGDVRCVKKYMSSKLVWPLLSLQNAIDTLFDKVKCYSLWEPNSI